MLIWTKASGCFKKTNGVPICQVFYMVEAPGIGKNLLILDAMEINNYKRMNRKR